LIEIPVKKMIIPDMMFLFNTKTALMTAAACIVLAAQPVASVDQSLLMGEWRKYDPEGTYLLYEKYIFRENGEALYGEQFIDGQELNIEARDFRLSGDILIIGMKKMIGKGKEYYRYKIISLTGEEMVLRLLSKLYQSEPERWVRPHRAPQTAPAKTK